MNWRVDGEFDSDVSVSILDENDFEICELDPFDGEWTAEDIRKARLIAAAPELLEALRRADIFISNELEVRRNSMLPDPDGDHSEYLESAEEAFSIVRAAIAKVEGRS